MEFNEKIPPPIFFSMNYARQWPWAGDHCYGVSLAYAAHILGEFGYRPVIVDGNNMVFVDANAKCQAFRNLTSDTVTLYEQGYSKTETRRKNFPWNENVDPWLSIVDNDPFVGARMIMDHFIKTDTYQKSSATFTIAVDPYIDRQLYSDPSNATIRLDQSYLQIESNEHNKEEAIQTEEQNKTEEGGQQLELEERGMSTTEKKKTAAQIKRLAYGPIPHYRNRAECMPNQISDEVKWQDFFHGGKFCFRIHFRRGASEYSSQTPACASSVHGKGVGPQRDEFVCGECWRE
jgi:hypothetical protein